MLPAAGADADPRPNATVAACASLMLPAAIARAVLQPNATAAAC